MVLPHLQQTSNISIMETASTFRRRRVVIRKRKENVVAWVEINFRTSKYRWVTRRRKGVAAHTTEEKARRSAVRYFKKRFSHLTPEFDDE